MSKEDEDSQREPLKRTAVALKDAGIHFALAGGYAAWARGGPEPAHDVDFVIAEAASGQAEQVLRQADLRVEHPAEDWPFKAFTDGAMVDILFRIGGVSVEAPLLDRASELEVLSVRMPVLTATDVLALEAQGIRRARLRLRRGDPGRPCPARTGGLGVATPRSRGQRLRRRLLVPAAADRRRRVLAPCGTEELVGVGPVQQVGAGCAKTTSEPMAIAV